MKTTLKSLITTKAREGFYLQYTSNFGRLTHEDGLERYLQWVDTVADHIDILETAIDTLSKSRPMSWHQPRLPEIKLFFYKLLAERDKKFKDLGQSNEDDVCTICSGSGWAWTVGMHENYDDFMEVREITCRCPAGAREARGRRDKLIAAMFANKQLFSELMKEEQDDCIRRKLFLYATELEATEYAEQFNRRKLDDVSQGEE